MALPFTIVLYTWPHLSLLASPWVHHNLLFYCYSTITINIFPILIHQYSIEFCCLKKNTEIREQENHGAIWSWKYFIFPPNCNSSKIITLRTQYMTGKFGILVRRICMLPELAWEAKIVVALPGPSHYFTY